MCCLSTRSSSTSCVHYQSPECTAQYQYASQQTGPVASPTYSNPININTYQGIGKNCDHHTILFRYQDYLAATWRQERTLEQLQMTNMSVRIVISAAWTRFPALGKMSQATNWTGSKAKETSTPIVSNLSRDQAFCRITPFCSWAPLQGPQIMPVYSCLRWSAANNHLGFFLFDIGGGKVFFAKYNSIKFPVEVERFPMNRTWTSARDLPLKRSSSIARLFPQRPITPLLLAFLRYWILFRQFLSN